MKRHLKQAQGGASLLICLIVLVLVTLMGLTTMKAAALQEKMSGGSADKTLAFEAAELALRDAETYIDASLTSGSGFKADCSGGLCLPSSAGLAVENTLDWDGGLPLIYGAKTGAAQLGGVSRQPAFVIELLTNMGTQGGDSVNLVSTGAPYRITAIGYGRQAATRVVLQTTYYKP